MPPLLAQWHRSLCIKIYWLRFWDWNLSSCDKAGRERKGMPKLKRMVRHWDRLEMFGNWNRKGQLQTGKQLQSLWHYRKQSCRWCCSLCGWFWFLWPTTVVSVFVVAVWKKLRNLKKTEKLATSDTLQAFHKKCLFAIICSWVPPVWSLNKISEGTKAIDGLGNVTRFISMPRCFQVSNNPAKQASSSEDFTASGEHLFSNSRRRLWLIAHRVSQATLFGDSATLSAARTWNRRCCNYGMSLSCFVAVKYISVNNSEQLLGWGLSLHDLLIIDEAALYHSR